MQEIVRTDIPCCCGRKQENTNKRGKDDLGRPKKEVEDQKLFVLIKLQQSFNVWKFLNASWLFPVPPDQCSDWFPSFHSKFFPVSPDQCSDWFPSFHSKFFPVPPDQCSDWFPSFHSKFFPVSPDQFSQTLQASAWNGPLLVGLNFFPSLQTCVRTGSLLFTLYCSQTLQASAWNGPLLAALNFSPSLQTCVWTGCLFATPHFFRLMHSTIREFSVNSGQGMLVNLQNKFIVTRQVIHPLAGAKSEHLSNCVEFEILATVNIRIGVL